LTKRKTLSALLYAVEEFQNLETVISDVSVSTYCLSSSGCLCSIFWIPRNPGVLTLVEEFVLECKSESDVCAEKEISVSRRSFSERALRSVFCYSATVPETGFSWLL